MFLSAGLIAESLGHDRIAGLGGAGRAMPVTFLALGLGGLSLMGLPPSGGFAAKWLLMKASIEAGQWVWAVVMLAGGLLAGGYLYRVLAPALSGESPAIESAASPQSRKRRPGAGARRRAARLCAAGVLRLFADRPSGRRRRAAMSALAGAAQEFGPGLLVAALGGAARRPRGLPCRRGCASVAWAMAPLAPLPALAAAILALAGAPFGVELPALRMSLWLDRPGAILLAAAALVWIVRQRLRPDRWGGQAERRPLRGLMAPDDGRQSRRLHRRRSSDLLSRLCAGQRPRLLPHRA